MTITAEMCIRALKTHGLSSTAAVISQFVGADSRAVATALRRPTQDGRVKRSWDKKANAFYYRFVRLTPKATP